MNTLEPLAAPSAEPSNLHDLFQRQQRASREIVLGYDQRMTALTGLLNAVLANEQALVDALHQDFGRRSAHETRLLEIMPVVDEIRHIRRQLRQWMKPRRARVNWPFFPSRAKVVYQPLGVVGVIGAWNYPVMLSLSPLVNALAAGNRVIIKPSELAPATAEVIAGMVRQCFVDDHVAVVTGGADLAAAFAALPFDHILFTGSTRVGTLVAQAAAANLTPVTLELGGKSPAVVHESFPTAVAADRICSAKFWNAGQTCVAPDYVLVHKHQLHAFQAAAAKVASLRHADPVSSADYTWMLNQAGYDRMQALLQDALWKGATVVPLVQNENPRPAGNRAFVPTIVLGVTDDMRVMQEEIFGPILPVLTYQTIDEAIQLVNSRPRPLALYYFDHNRHRIDDLIDRTVSGGITVNDCIYHLVQHGLPFGGVGPSGQGAYHGFDGFATFSKKKGVLLQNRLVAHVFGKLTKPPYNRWTDRVANFLIGKP
jgi:coniferyl-aldehyde dehydrogenase